MSHPEQLGFFAAVADANQALLDGARIIEIGSYDVNGSVRALFAPAREYVGVDLSEGPGVDVVAFGHEITDPDGSYDLALSGECFEHDSNWAATFANMARLTRPGGLTAFTCASRGRPEHGTARTDLTLSPGTQSRGIDHYRNLEAADFADLPLDDWFSEWKFWYLPTSFDLYFAGVRRGGSADQARIPDDARVRALRGEMPIAHKAVRIPLRILAKLLPHDWYQNVIRLYWKGLLRLSQERFVRSERT